MTAKKAEQAQQESNNQPVDHVRSGRVKAAIWERQGKDGTFYNVTFDRSYQEGEETRYTQSFGTGDLANVASAAQQAELRIAQLYREKNRG